MFKLFNNIIDFIPTLDYYILIFYNYITINLNSHNEQKGDYDENNDENMYFYFLLKSLWQ